MISQPPFSRVFRLIVQESLRAAGFTFIFFIDFPARGPRVPFTRLATAAESLARLIADLMREGLTWPVETDMNYSFDENYIPRIRVREVCASPDHSEETTMSRSRNYSDSWTSSVCP